jgi:hypothetical protein
MEKAIKPIEIENERKRKLAEEIAEKARLEEQQARIRSEKKRREEAERQRLQYEGPRRSSRVKAAKVIYAQEDTDSEEFCDDESKSETLKSASALGSSPDSNEDSFSESAENTNEDVSDSDVELISKVPRQKTMVNLCKDVSDDESLKNELFGNQQDEQSCIDADKENEIKPSKITRSIPIVSATDSLNQYAL